MLVVIQVGQAGNLVGAVFWQIVSQALPCPSLVRAGVASQPTARCVLIDSDPRAVAAAQTEPLLAGCALVTAQNGRFGCWARGYSGDTSTSAERSLLSRSLAAIRKEVERCSSAPDILVLHGLAGGTGGGFACRLLEALRSAFSELFLCSAALLPLGCGCSSLSAPLGFALCLQFLQCYCDGVLLLNSEDALTQLEKAERDKGVAQPRAAFSDVNRVLASQLAAVFLPAPLITLDGSNVGSSTASTSLATSSSGGWPLRSLVSVVCPHPSLKFVEVRQQVAPAAAAFDAEGPAWASVASALSGSAPRRVDAASDEDNGRWGRQSAAGLVVTASSAPLVKQRVHTATATAFVLRGVGSAAPARGGSAAAPPPSPLTTAASSVVKHFETPGAWPLAAGLSGGGGGGGSLRSGACVARATTARLPGAASQRVLTLVSNRSTAIGHVARGCAGGERLLAAGAVRSTPITVSCIVAACLTWFPASAAVWVRVFSGGRGA